MAEGDTLTCPLCDGNKFVEVETSTHWTCYSRSAGGSHTETIDVRMPKYPGKGSGPDTRYLGYYNEACSTCGFVILRVDTDQLKKAAGQWRWAENKAKKAAAAAKRKKAAEKAARTRAKNRAVKKAKYISTLKKKLRRLEKG